MEELQARHRKELKALDGEKRAAFKKTKSTKGKKAKEVLQALEEEYATKLANMELRHQEEVAAEGLQEITEDVIQAGKEEEIEEALAARERKQAKARRKREQQRLAQQQKEQQQAEDRAGPSARSMELDILKEKLDPLSLQIKEVASDGHCLYRAIAAQYNDSDDMSSYSQMRDMCATTLAEHEDDFSPFVEYSETAPTFGAYVERVRSSADWGGHVELRALSVALHRVIMVYSAQQEPLVIRGEDTIGDDEEPIRLSYHLHYYSLGEHYNCVIKKEL